MAKLLPYQAPSWAGRLKNLPAYYLKLATRPTPIQDWNLPGLPDNFKVSVKRDDMTGSLLSGNKVRKLEFLLADALFQGYDAIVTAGGIQSNHCRATAVAAKEVGLECYLLLRSKDFDIDKDNTTANLAINRLVGAQIYLVPNESLEGGLWKRLHKFATRMWDEKRKKVYSVPLGGSNHVGTCGYIEAFQELISQNVLEDYDDIFMAVGSGGTLAGLSIGNYLTGSKVRIHGVCVCDNANYFYEHVQRELDEFGLEDVKARDIVDVVDGYKGRGYAMSTDEELAQVLQISQSTGVLLDPVYNLKAVRGMLKEMETNPGRFKGSKILYLHTGGVFGLLDGRLSHVLLGQAERGNQTLKIWQDAEMDPLKL